MARRSFAFTLVEVLVVLTLLGLAFGLISFSFYSYIRNALSLQESAERLRSMALLKMDIKRKILSSKEIAVKDNMVFMITNAGSYHAGTVKCGYVYKDGELYYYEFPYPYGDIFYYEEDKLIKVAKLSRFEVWVEGKKEYRGRPPKWLRILMDEEKMEINPVF